MARRAVDPAAVGAWLASRLPSALAAQAVHFGPLVHPQGDRAGRGVALVIGPADARHVLGVVEPWTLIVDGPSGVPHATRDHRDLEASLALLTERAEGWLARPDAVGAIDAGLALAAWLGEHGVGTDWRMVVDGAPRRLGCGLALHRGGRRVHAVHVWCWSFTDGVHVQVGDATRTVQTVRDLAAFDAHEGPAIAACIARYDARLARLDRAEPVAHAIVALARTRWPGHELGVAAHREYLSLDDEPAAVVTWRAPGGPHATLLHCTSANAGEVAVRGLGLDLVLSGADDVEPRAHTLTAALSRGFRSFPVGGSTYRVRRAFGAARPGDVTRCAGLVPVGRDDFAWVFDGPGDRRTVLLEASAECAALFAEPWVYLERAIDPEDPPRRRPQIVGFVMVLALGAPGHLHDERDRGAPPDGAQGAQDAGPHAERRGGDEATPPGREERAEDLGAATS